MFHGIGLIVSFLMALSGLQTHAVPVSTPQVESIPTTPSTTVTAPAVNIPQTVPQVASPEAKIETPKIEVKAPAITPKPAPVQNKCNPNYSGCLKSGAGDYDCAGGSGNGPNYTGKVEVLGYDEFGLDRDNDGWGCDR